mmetsp:Transcript_27142/g.45172  ORF Transcript_27142/g.45172 Transcript_27142/m.45172 type:complete len:80 (-) Transcript_27142:839-1078(-)
MGYFPSKSHKINSLLEYGMLSPKIRHEALFWKEFNYDTSKMSSASASTFTSRAASHCKPSNSAALALCIGSCCSASFNQ